MKNHTLWALQPVSLIAWHQFPFERDSYYDDTDTKVKSEAEVNGSTYSARRRRRDQNSGRLDFLRRTYRFSAPKCVAWNDDNFIAIATPQPLYFGSATANHLDDFPAPASFEGSSVDWTFSWRVLLVNPDQPNEVVNIVDKSRPIHFLEWSPSWCPHLLLICTNSSVAVWARHNHLANQYHCHARLEFGVSDTILCCWVDFKQQHLDFDEARDSPLLGQKFQPLERPTSPFNRDPGLKHAFVTLSADGSLRWFYRRATMKCAEYQLKNLDSNISHASIVFTSFDSARIAISCEKSPNVIMSFDIKVDYAREAFVFSTKPSDPPLFTYRLEITENDPSLPAVPRGEDGASSNGTIASLSYLMSTLDSSLSDSISSAQAVSVLQLVFDEFRTNLLFTVAQLMKGQKKHFVLQRWTLDQAQWSLHSSALLLSISTDHVADVTIGRLRCSKSKLAVSINNRVQVRDSIKLSLLGEHFGGSFLQMTETKADADKNSKQDGMVVGEQAQKEAAHMRRKRKASETFDDSVSGEQSDDAMPVDAAQVQVKEENGSERLNGKRRKTTDAGGESKSPADAQAWDGGKAGPTAASKPLPFDFALSPNGTSIFIMYNDCRCEVVLLTSVFLPADISQARLAQNLANMFELSLVRNRSWWDVQALVLAFFSEPPLPTGAAPPGSPATQERTTRFANLDKEVILCLMKDLEACTQRSADYARHYWPLLEQIKASLYRSRLHSVNNYMNCQLRLALNYAIDVLQLQFKNWRVLSNLMKPETVLSLDDAALGPELVDKDRQSLFALADFAGNMVRFILRSAAEFTLRSLRALAKVGSITSSGTPIPGIGATPPTSTDPTASMLSLSSEHLPHVSGGTPGGYGVPTPSPTLPNFHSPRGLAAGPALTDTPSPRLHHSSNGPVIVDLDAVETPPRSTGIETVEIDDSDILELDAPTPGGPPATPRGLRNTSSMLPRPAHAHDEDPVSYEPQYTQSTQSTQSNSSQASQSTQSYPSSQASQSTQSCQSPQSAQPYPSPQALQSTQPYPSSQSSQSTLPSGSQPNPLPAVASSAEAAPQDVFLVPQWMQSLTVQPSNLEQFLAISADESFESGFSFFTEPHSMHLLKQAATLGFIFGKIRGVQVGDATQLLQTIVELYQISTKLKGSAFNLALAPQQLMELVNSSKGVAEFYFSRLKMDREASIRELDLLPGRFRILELSHYDTIGSSIVTGLPTEAVDVLARVRIAVRDGVRQCTRCNRFTQILARSVEEVRPWMQNWADKCPFCHGSWQYFFAK